MGFSLQKRITFIILSASAILIFIFTFILLNSQLDNLTRYNSYQASLSSLLAKSLLENVIKKVNPNRIQAVLQDNLENFKNSNIASFSYIFDSEGKIIAATDNTLVGKKTSYKELEKWNKIESLPERQILSEIDKVKRMLKIYVPLSRSKKEPILYLLRLNFPLGNISEAFMQIYKTTILLALIIVLANCIMGYLLSKRIIGPLKVLNHVTKIIASGNLNIRTHIKTKDELEELGNTFNKMTEELVKMKERAENANPLTKLPGNIMIREEIEKRLACQQVFYVLYLDLDNFKAFNDKYGIAKGDEAIKLTAEIIKETIKKFKNKDDFLGHEGGDDFILITNSPSYSEMANHIINEFDKQIRSLYSPEDLKQGYITSLSRDGSTKQFPIMTISIAGVTNEHRRISSYAEVTNIAAEVKKYAKLQPKSIFVLDRRKV